MSSKEEKEGVRIFERKKDAELAKNVNESSGEEELEIYKVKVVNAKKAGRKGVSIHPDLSIASRMASNGDTGWIVKEKNRDIKDEFRESLRIIE